MEGVETPSPQCYDEINMPSAYSVNDLPRGHMRGHCLLDDIATSIA